MAWAIWHCKFLTWGMLCMHAACFGARLRALGKAQPTNGACLRGLGRPSLLMVHAFVAWEGPAY
eukprot:1160610-Pelagomonas_calceolata.AAC.22